MHSYYKTAIAFCLGLQLTGFNVSFAQQIQVPIKNYRVSIPNLYHLDPVKDGLTTAAGITLIIAGNLIGNTKTHLTKADLNDPEAFKRIPSFDVRATHQDNKTFLAASNVLLYTAMALPFTSFIDLRVKGHAETIIAMYFETLSISTGLYSIAAGSITRRRPLTYNPDFSDTVRLGKKGKNVQNSFFSGHVTSAAAATFFGAKVFTDFRPFSKLVPLVWTAAASVPLFVAVARYKAGKHFPSDVITGYIVGSTVGLLVPTLHKVSNERIVLSPIIGDEKGVSLVYTF
ncbi:MAG: phosphatase PAP2 family protein [Chitinophagales bacterium]|nr:phosphatase PAP2 family protein [Chitinophagales bacterium]